MKHKDYGEVEFFYGNKIADALEACQQVGYRPLFMPEVVDARLKTPKSHNSWRSWFMNPTKVDAYNPWKNWFTTLSIKATGRTNHGSPVEVYVHTDHHLSDPVNIRAAQRKLINGAGPIPQEEFERLLGLEGKTNGHGNQLVYVIDHKSLAAYKYEGFFRTNSVLKDPRTIPFLGGEDRAQQYLEQYQKIGRNLFGPGIWVLHSDDLTDTPVARFLHLGYSDVGGLVGNRPLNSEGKFFSVRQSEVATLESRV